MPPATTPGPEAAEAEVAAGPAPTKHRQEGLRPPPLGGTLAVLAALLLVLLSSPSSLAWRSWVPEPQQTEGEDGPAEQLQLAQLAASLVHLQLDYFPSSGQVTNLTALGSGCAGLVVILGWLQVTLVLPGPLGRTAGGRRAVHTMLGPAGLAAPRRTYTLDQSVDYETAFVPHNYRTDLSVLFLADQGYPVTKFRCSKFF